MKKATLIVNPVAGKMRVKSAFFDKRVIIDNLKKVNASLGRITGGDLNVMVDVRSNEEFASLSDDINSTVAT